MDHWPDQQEILSRCRDWLHQTQRECESFEEYTCEEPSGEESIGLCQLIEQFTALRHDMKLLTKATRSTEERNEATLLSMQSAIEQFRSIEPKEHEAVEKTARPLVEAIIGLDESLERCRDAIGLAKHHLLKDVDTRLRDERDQLDELFRKQSWWRRWLCRGWYRAVRQLHADHKVDAHRNVFDSLLEGYDLIAARLNKTMQQQSIVRIQCIGEMVDPTRMTAVGTVNDLSRVPGTVVEEVRPGYCHHGKVIHFAEVKAVSEY